MAAAEDTPSVIYRYAMCENEIKWMGFYATFVHI